MIVVLKLNVHLPRCKATSEWNKKILVPAVPSSIWRSAWNLFQNCPASEMHRSLSFPRWNVKAVKTLGSSFQLIIGLRRPKFWLLSRLHNKKGFPPRSYSWLRTLLLLYSLLWRGIVWEGILRKKWLWSFQVVFSSPGASAKIYLEKFLPPHSISCAQNEH